MHIGYQKLYKNCPVYFNKSRCFLRISIWLGILPVYGWGSCQALQSRTGKRYFLKNYVQYNHTTKKIFYLNYIRNLINILRQCALKEIYNLKFS